MPRVHEMTEQHSITPTSGAWAEMDADMQAWLLEIAANVKVLLARLRADDAYDEMEFYQLEPEAQVALWTRFESGERRVLKAVAEARKQRSAT